MLNNKRSSRSLNSSFILGILLCLFSNSDGQVLSSILLVDKSDKAGIDFVHFAPRPRWCEIGPTVVGSATNEGLSLVFEQEKEYWKSNGRLMTLDEFANIHLIKMNGSGAAWLDYDKDGDWDLYLVNCQGDESVTNALYENIGNGKFVYIIGGEGSIQNENGETQSRHFSDGYRYSLRYENWEPIADAPHPVTGAPGIAYGQSHILIFGGNTWKQKDVDSSKDHPSYSNDLLVYHTITDSWVVKGGLPLGVVSSEAVSWGDGIAITGGETEPGLMTPKVQMMIYDAGANASFGIINYAFLLLYMVALIYMGLYFSKKEKGTKDYFVASHRIPWWAAGLSILGTGLSALTYISYPALVYSTDWFLFPQRIGLIIAPLIIIYFFLPF